MAISNDIPVEDPACSQHDIHALMDDIDRRTGLYEQPTVYDILRLPGYKSFKAHQTNIENLIEWLSDDSCPCKNRKDACKFLVERAFAQIDTTAKKTKYDVLSSLHLIDPAIPEKPIDQTDLVAIQAERELASIALAHRELNKKANIGPEVPTTANPPFYGTPPAVLPRDSNARIVQYPWRYYFADIHYAPNIAFQQVLPDKFCRRRENSFWLSLSLALTGTDRFWAKFKADVKHYYEDCIKGGELALHPRAKMYRVFDGEITRRSRDQFAAELAASNDSNASTDSNDPDPNFKSEILPLENQLLVDEPISETMRKQGATLVQINGAILDMSNGYIPDWYKRGNHPSDVTLELYQIIADCFHIELFVIQDRYVQVSPNRKPYRPWVVRGDHNTRQIFMLQFADAEYIAVKPVNGYAEDIRFAKHMPNHGQIKVEGFSNQELYDSALMRSPFVQHDEHGIPVVPTVFLRGYNRPVVPEHVMNTPAMVEATKEEILAMANSECWR